MTFTDIYRVLWRRKLPLLALTWATVAVTALLTLRQEPRYEGGMIVRVQASEAATPNERLQASQGLARTYADLIASESLDVWIRKVVRRQLPPKRLRGMDFSAKQQKDLAFLYLSAQREPR